MIVFQYMYVQNFYYDCFSIYVCSDDCCSIYVCSDVAVWVCVRACMCLCGCVCMCVPTPLTRTKRSKRDVCIRLRGGGGAVARVHVPTTFCVSICFGGLIDFHISEAWAAFEISSRRR
jgi:hypothetical protein